MAGMSTDQRDAPSLSRRTAVVRMIGLDIVGPLLVYRLCRGFGVPTIWSLVISGSSPGLGVLFDWLRWRTLEIVGAVVLGQILLSIVLALISGNPKVVLLEGAATTIAFALVCLASLTRERPLIFYFGQAFYGGRHSADGVQMAAEYEKYPDARSFWQIVTVVWAIAYLLESAGRIYVVERLSTATALTFNRTTPWLITAALISWTVWWGTRTRQKNVG
jgi:hypothetical protein